MALSYHRIVAAPRTARPTRHANITGMTTSGAPGPPTIPVAEHYPGETLALLRAIHHDLAELRALRDEFGPLLDSIRQGRGLIGRAARRNGAARDDYPGTHPSTRPGTAPGEPGTGVGPGIWGRARGAHGT